MAVASMKLVNIAGPLDRLDEIIDLTGSSGVFQPEDAMTFFSNNKNFSPILQEDLFRPLLSALENALPENCTFSTPAVEDAMNYSTMKEKTEAFLSEISERNCRTEQLQKKILERDTSLQKLEHFIGLNLDMKEICACKYTSVRFGRIPTRCMERMDSFGKNTNIFAFKCTEDNEFTYGVFFSPKSDSGEMDRILSGFYFERIYVPNTGQTIENAYENLLQQKETCVEELKENNHALQDFWKERKDGVSELRRQIQAQISYYELKKHAVQYGEGQKAFLLVGWVPAWEGRHLLKTLSGMKGIDCNIESAENEIEHNPPSHLKNLRCFKPFEFFVDMYGLPTYGEFDPTPFVAITYTLLFGIMFGDVGQGLILSLIGWLMWKLKKMKLGRVLIPCGISSACFGLIYGSVFGLEEVLNPLYKSLFGWEEKPVDVMAPATTNMIIYLSIALGVVLIAVALLLNIISCIRRKNLPVLLFSANGLPGLLFYSALVGGLVCQIRLQIPVMQPLYILFLIVLPLLLMFLQEPLANLITRKKEKIQWGNYLAQSFFELFETLLSFATNTMSFLRVGAFVLVHAGMMMVGFTLAEMVPSAFGVIIVAFWNGLVIALEGLLVGIQVLRLEFYEMFSRFFEGGGRPFTPSVLKK